MNPQGASSCASESHTGPRCAPAPAFCTDGLCGILLLICIEIFLGGNEFNLHFTDEGTEGKSPNGPLSPLLRSRAETQAQALQFTLIKALARVSWGLPGKGIVPMQRMGDSQRRE